MLVNPYWINIFYITSFLAMVSAAKMLPQLFTTLFYLHLHVYCPLPSLIVKTVLIIMFRAFISAVYLYIPLSRSKGRLPVLTYYHAQTSAALLRCAQPLSGIKGRSLKCLVSKSHVTLLIKRAMPDSQLYPCNLYLINGYLIHT